ncbi:MAG: RNA-binding protein [Gammaproteobacteria bacterium]|nr:RNA-binding protein [Gammaproteobacteria bacterium]
MFAFIGNLPGELSLVELQGLLGDHEMSVDYSMHRHEHNDNHFVLAKASSKEDLESLVSQLHGRKIHNNTVEIRKFINRRELEDWVGEDRRSYQLDLDMLFPDS